MEPETAAQAIKRKSAVKECFGRPVELASKYKPLLYVLLQVALDNRKENPHTCSLTLLSSQCCAAQAAQ